MGLGILVERINSNFRKEGVEVQNVQLFAPSFSVHNEGSVNVSPKIEPEFEPGSLTPDPPWAL